MTTRTHEGLVRVRNEDSVLIDADQGLAIVADGMGGLMAGDEASAVAVEAVRREVCDSPDRIDTDPDLGAVMQAAHRRVIERAESLNFLGKMGTTLVICLIRDQRAWIAHAGDSRAYVLNDTLQQLSKDHTVAQRQIDMGQLNPKRAYLSPGRHVLTQAVGMPGVLNPQLLNIAFESRVMMCTDGLCDMVSHDEIEALLKVDDIEEAATELLRAALDAGGRDNVSLTLIDPI